MAGLFVPHWNGAMKGKYFNFENFLKHSLFNVVEEVLEDVLRVKQRLKKL